MSSQAGAGTPQPKRSSAAETDAATGADDGAVLPVKRVSSKMLAGAFDAVAATAGAEVIGADITDAGFTASATLDSG